ncbi:hypothetical protein SLA2020_412560 [Shorea laevis]
MRAAMQEKETAPSGDVSEQEGNQSFTVTEIKTLKAELEIVKTQMAELQSDYSDLQREYEKQNKSQRMHHIGVSVGGRSRTLYMLEWMGTKLEMNSRDPTASDEGYPSPKFS